MTFEFSFFQSFLAFHILNCFGNLGQTFCPIIILYGSANFIIIVLLRLWGRTPLYGMFPSHRHVTAGMHDLSMTSAWAITNNVKLYCLARRYLASLHCTDCFSPPIIWFLVPRHLFQLPFMGKGRTELHTLQDAKGTSLRDLSLVACSCVCSFACLVSMD